MTWILLVIVGLLLAAVGIGIRARNMQYWIVPYVRQWPRRRRPVQAVTHVYVCIADHFEPFGGGASPTRARARLARWLSDYPQVASAHRDSGGRHPRHTFFYPIEEYAPDVLDGLADLCRRGWGDVDVHFHHDRDTAENLRRSLLGFTAQLAERHGLLVRPLHQGMRPYCFVHGNWALDNSRPDGRWCGVDNELSVLAQTGCVADFTMPSAPSDTQCRVINSLYFARGRPGRRKSHDHGRDVDRARWAEAGEILMVQGPLGLNSSSRKLGVIPRIENGEISADARPSEARIALWDRLAPRLDREATHLFIKLHTHGAEDPTMDRLFGGDFDRLWSGLEERYRDRSGYRLHYLTAWEMYETIRRLAPAAGLAP